VPAARGAPGFLPATLALGAQATPERKRRGSFRILLASVLDQTLQFEAPSADRFCCLKGIRSFSRLYHTTPTACWGLRFVDPSSPAGSARQLAPWRRGSYRASGEWQCRPTASGRSPAAGNAGCRSGECPPDPARKRGSRTSHPTRKVTSRKLS